MSGWTALTIRFPDALEDAVVGVLHDAGTLGIQAGASDENGSSPFNSAVAYFEPDADSERLRRSLEDLGEVMVLRIERIADEAWVERQEEGRRPLAIGRRLLIVPDLERETGLANPIPEGAATATPERSPERRDPASRGNRMRGAGVGAGTGMARTKSRMRPAARDSAPVASVPDHRIVLVVPPKRAFGTGEHATTRLCLELLEEMPLAGARVLDLGTGSGILALAAAALGAHEVVAVDNDPEAIEIAQENLELNAVRLWGAPGTGSKAGELHDGNGPRGASIELLVGDLSCARGRFDLIVSNIYAGVLEGLAAPIAALQRTGGALILSGFSPAETDKLVSVYEGAGYRSHRRGNTTDWAAVHLVKHA